MLHIKVYGGSTDIYKKNKKTLGKLLKSLDKGLEILNHIGKLITDHIIFLRRCIEELCCSETISHEFKSKYDHALNILLLSIQWGLEATREIIKPVTEHHKSHIFHVTYKISRRIHLDDIPYLKIDNMCVNVINRDFLIGDMQWILLSSSDIINSSYSLYDDYGYHFSKKDFMCAINNEIEKLNSILYSVGSNKFIFGEGVLGIDEIISFFNLYGIN
jgi:hypothetical protein